MKKQILLLLLVLTSLGAFAQLNELVGIGVRLQIDSGRGYKLPLVLALVPNSPALAAGVKEGDFILKVDGQTTRDVLLKDVVDMIVGKEGTEVKLVVERAGTTRNFAIVRKSYKYASSWYQSAVKDNDFCTALTTLMNDAPYNFQNTIDTNHFTEGKKAFAPTLYNCKIKVPGAQKVSIAASFGGYTGIIDLGSFKTPAEVSAAGAPVIAKIKTCFPDYYYDAAPDAKGMVTVEIGRTFTDGYESSILRLYYYFDDELQTYQMNLDVNGGKASRFHSTTGAAQDNAFATPVRKIYYDIDNKYRNVKGERHQEKSTGLFSSGSTWYDIIPLPEGATSCVLSEGGLSMSNGCSCRFIVSEDMKAAADVFADILVKMQKGLGSEFVYTTDRQELDMTIPQDAKAVATFGIKKKKNYESAPLISLVLVKYTDGKYAVNLLFHEFGF